MSIDYQNYVELSAVVDAFKPLSTFVKDTLFNKEWTSTEETVGWEKVTATDGVAQIALKDSSGKPVQKTSRTAKYTKLLTTKETIEFSIKEFESLKRFGSKSSAEKLSQFDEYVLKHIQMLKDRVTRRQEQWCVEALATGKLEIVDYDLIQSVDFGYTVDNFKTKTSGTDKWNGGSASDPIADIVAWSRIIAKLTGMKADTVMLGEAAATAFRANAMVLKQLNNLNTLAGQLNLTASANTPAGGQLIMTLPNGTKIYEYNQVYTDYAGSTASMINTNSCIVTSTQAAGIYFEYVNGTINRFDPKSSDFKLQQTPKMRADIIKNADGSSGMFQLEHCSLPLIKSVEPVIVATVIG